MPNTNDICSRNSCNSLQSLKGFRSGHLNITSLIKYIDQLRIYLTREPLDILSINETRLDESISDLVVNIEGYNIIRNDRKRDGGGVAIYYRDCLKVKDRSELIPIGLEAVCIEVTQTKSKPLLIASVYRPPSARVEIFDKIETLLQNLDADNKEVIILGDFNCDLLAIDKDSHTKKFLDLINIYQMTQHINEPTRVTLSTETLIDLALTNMPERITNSGVLHIGISDHSLIYICRKIAFAKSYPKIVETRTYKNYNAEYFNTDLTFALTEYNWESVNPNTLWSNFKTAFEKVSNIYAPIITRRVRSKYSPWLTNNIKKQMNRRDYLKRKAVKTKSANIHNAYKKMRNHVNKMIKKLKMRHFHQCIEEQK